MMLRLDMALRTAAMGCRIQPSIATPCLYHTTATIPTSKSTTRPSSWQSNSIAQASALSPTYTSVRFSSTDSAQPVTTAPSTAASASPLLDWNTFFKLRKTRRRLQLGSSVGTSFLSMIGGAQALAMSDMDAIVGQIPLDPFITLGLITFSCGGAGWLLGPIVGTGIFNMTNSKLRGEMIVKEKEFYDRVKKYRVDPSASSMANPVPDYYGEKISSVQDYRQWLKDQRAFNKKRQTFVK